MTWNQFSEVKLQCWAMTLKTFPWNQLSLVVISFVDLTKKMFILLLDPISQHGKIKKKLLSLKKSNQLFSNFFEWIVKPLLSRNFCQKCVRENSCNFHTVPISQYGKMKNCSHHVMSRKKLFVSHFFSN